MVFKSVKPSSPGMKLTARLALLVISAAVYLGLAVLGIGGLAAFLSHSALIALAAIFFALSIAAVFAGGNVSPGVREDRRNRWVVVAVVAIGLVSAYLPAWSDRVGFWTIDGEVTRWIGVAIVAIGGILRIAPVFILGNRFSGLVAIQPEHTLVTAGIYGVIRHPSYLGLLLSAFGWALAFRSGLGVLLAAILIPIIVVRMNSEEQLLAAQFGAEYANYRARTSRLIPGVY
ncbi:MAG TPA: isoprenylcysteine carboxylmethyltransferase family protein [Candidatus Acidoferrales bacterium]|nr:isoprenylcysteine carboxylmethyltransferase family protein [Candidatus Acidoferrales bacterium]